MALDEVLLSRVAAGARPRTVRFWEWTEPCLVLGSHQSVGNEVDTAETARLGFRIVRRMSGGGTMLVEPGRVITWSLYLPEADVRGLTFVESFAALDAFAVRALRGLGVNAAYRPINDIVSPAGKLAGAAQARRRGAVLHHVTMAYSIDPGLVPRLIRIGRQGVSRLGVRSAEKVVSPLAGLCAASLAEVVAALRSEFCAEAGCAQVSLAAGDLAAARELSIAKYERPEWLERLP